MRLIDFGAVAEIKCAQKCAESNARVAELVDALDLGSSAVRRESSSLSFRTK
jgi:hypothetical protein